MVKDEDKVWKQFLIKHFQMFVLWLVAAILAFIVAIRVFLWVVAETQAQEIVPMYLGEWAMKHVINFLLHLIFWEIIIVGIPVIIFIAAVYFLWWKKLPDKEQKEYKESHLFGDRNRRNDAGGFIAFLINVVFVIKVYLDDNWTKVFAEWKFDYLVESYLWAVIIVLIIIGIPILLGGAWWISTKMKK